MKIEITLIFMQMLKLFAQFPDVIGSVANAICSIMCRKGEVIKCN